MPSLLPALRTTGAHLIKLRALRSVAVPLSANRDVRTRRLSSLPSVSFFDMPTGPVGVLKLVAGGVGGAVAHFLSRRDWQLRKFLRRVNLSLCMITPPSASNDAYQLKIRTLFEKDIADIFLRNRVMVSMILDHARLTTVEQPFIILPNADSWFALTAILNEISSHFSPGYIYEDHDASSVVLEHYWFGLTREAYTTASPRFEKIRVIMIKEAHLRNWGATLTTARASSHSDRWKTLDAMAELYQKQRAIDQTGPGAVDKQHYLMRLELALPRAVDGLHLADPTRRTSE